MLGAGAAASAFPASILKALAIPARRRTGTIQDVKHIVFFMQENRSFDHYFGTLRGVRGFGDPHPVRLADGTPVWAQPGGAPGHVLPFHPGAPNLGLRFLEDLPHDWTSTQRAWNQGRYDSWVKHKGATTMTYLVRSDIPFHYALADAFTICDAYHCSLLGPTDPNRMYMWTGWVGNDGRGGGPVVDDAEAGYSWTTYPERLQAAGVSWKVYQDTGIGLTAANAWGWGKDAYIGNYGDNSLLYFRQVQNAAPGSPLHARACTGTRMHAGGTLFDEFRRDLRLGRLPQVSWIVAPEAYCEHPNWPANYGAWYTAQILDALTSVPEVWSSSVLFLTYDENDGFFDHMVPPTPDRSTVSVENEMFPGTARYPAGPYGLGVRVPMLVISPWSKGGWVSSEVFDHSSLLRFLECRFRIAEPNITPWRRAVCGDLTATLDFSTPQPTAVSLPPTAAYAPPDRSRHPDYQPALPPAQPMPRQEPGQRPARPVPYNLHVEAHATSDAIRLVLSNAGRATAVLQVRSRTHAPRSFTLAPHTHLEDSWTVGASFELEVHGPNGFYRALAGRGTAPEPVLSYDAPNQSVTLTLRADRHLNLEIHDAYGSTLRAPLRCGELWRHSWSVAATSGWYDLQMSAHQLPGSSRQFAGHIECGKSNMSDPLLAIPLDSAAEGA